MKNMVKSNQHPIVHTRIITPKALILTAIGEQDGITSLFPTRCLSTSNNCDTVFVQGDTLVIIFVPFFSLRSLASISFHGWGHQLWNTLIRCWLLWGAQVPEPKKKDVPLLGVGKFCFWFLSEGVKERRVWTLIELMWVIDEGGMLTISGGWVNICKNSHIHTENVISPVKCAWHQVFP